MLLLTKDQSPAGCIAGATARSAAFASGASTSPAAPCPVQLSTKCPLTSAAATAAAAATAQCWAFGVRAGSPSNAATAAERRAPELHTTELALNPATAVRCRASPERTASPSRPASSAAAISAVWNDAAVRVHAGHARGSHAAAARSGTARRGVGGGHSCGAVPGPAAKLHAAGSPAGAAAAAAARSSACLPASRTPRAAATAASPLWLGPGQAACRRPRVSAISRWERFPYTSPCATLIYTAVDATQQRPQPRNKLRVYYRDPSVYPPRAGLASMGERFYFSFPHSKG